MSLTSLQLLRNMINDLNPGALSGALANERLMTIITAMYDVIASGSGGGGGTVQIILRQGSNAERQTVTFASGEPVWTTDTKKMFVGDGVTIGGIAIGGGAGLMGQYDAFIVVATTNNAVTNGQNLLDSFELARSITPNGQARTPTNRAALILPPATYDLGDEGELFIDESYIDLIGLTSNRANQLITSHHTQSGKGTVHQDVSGTRIENITFDITGENPDNQDGLDPVAYFTDNPATTVAKNCAFTVSDKDTASSPCHGMSGYLTSFGGSWTDCDGGDYSFGSGCQFDGIAERCIGGTASFGADAQFSGQCYNCRAHSGSFSYSAAGIMAGGVVLNCMIDDGQWDSFQPSVAGAVVDMWSRDGIGNSAHFVFPGSKQPVEALANNADYTFLDSTDLVLIGVKASLNFNFGSHAYSGCVTDGSGNLFVCDTGNHTIRKITPAGVVSTWAGAAGQTGSADGLRSSARFNRPTGICIDGSGNLYVNDNLNFTIRKINASGFVTTLAGTAGVRGDVNGTGAAASFFYAVAMAFDGTDIFIGDRYSIRKITTAGVVTLFSGVTLDNGSVDGDATTARFGAINSIACDGAGNIYVLDTGMGIRKVDSVGAVTTVKPSFFAISLAIDSANGFLFSGDSGSIHKILISDFTDTLVAGSDSESGYVDGTGAAARFAGIDGMFFKSGILYVNDNNNGGGLVRKADASTWVVTTLAGTPGVAGSSDSGLGPIVGAFSNDQPAYKIDGVIIIEADNLTFAANQTLRISLAVFFGAPFDTASASEIPGTDFTFSIGVRSSYTGLIAVIPIPPIVQQFLGGASIGILGKLSAAPGGGSVKATYAKLIGFPSSASLTSPVP